MPLPLGFGISSVNAGVAARRVIVPYGCHGSRRAGSPPWPPVPRCGMFPRSSRRGGACPSRRVSEFFRSTLGWRRAGSSRPTDVMVHEGRAALRGRPSSVTGRFPVYPVGEGLAPPAGFRNFFGQRWGGGAPGRRALRMSWSTKGGQPSVAARPRCGTFPRSSRRILEQPRPACPDPHPLPRLVGTRRSGEMVQAGILHRIRARWPGRNEARNRILRAGNLAEGYRGIPRNRGVRGRTNWSRRELVSDGDVSLPGDPLVSFLSMGKKLAPRGETLRVE